MTPTDPHGIDPIARLSALGEKLEPIPSQEEYITLKPALLDLYTSDRATFAVAADLVKEKLGTGRRDLEAGLKPLLGEEEKNGKPRWEARELLNQMGQTRPLRLAQDFVDGRLWYGVIAGEDKLLLNSDRELLAVDNALP